MPHLSPAPAWPSAPDTAIEVRSRAFGPRRGAWATPRRPELWRRGRPESRCSAARRARAGRTTPRRFLPVLVDTPDRNAIQRCVRGRISCIGAIGTSPLEPKPILPRPCDHHRAHFEHFRMGSRFGTGFRADQLPIKHVDRLPPRHAHWLPAGYPINMTRMLPPFVGIGQQNAPARGQEPDRPRLNEGGRVFWYAVRNDEARKRKHIAPVSGDE